MRNWKEWKDEEISILVKDYSRVSTQVLAKLLDRTCSSIHHRARDLGLNKSKVWTKEQTNLLKRLYGGGF